MLKLCNIDIENSKRVFEEIKKLAKKIKLKFNADVYLYGSFAKNQIHEASDIDLIVVGDFEGKMPQRIGKILEFTDLPIEPLVYTKGEFRKMKKTNSFIKHILKEAKKL